jgi:SET domain-containing protein
MLLRFGPSTIHGLGVFAVADLPKKSLIEICPVILIPESHLPLIDQTPLFDYYYSWPTGEGAVALGLGSMYNHAPEPNATYEINVENRTIEIVTIRFIRAGEEVTISYGGINNQDLWFEVLEAPAKN